MQVTVEMSIYPLAEEFLPAVVAFIRALEASRQQSGAGVEELVVNQMSTQLRGELGAVQRAINDAMTMVHEQGVRFALVVKYLNGDLPLAAAVDLGAVEPR